jgi:hypothetical protein
LWAAVSVMRKESFLAGLLGWFRPRTFAWHD